MKKVLFRFSLIDQDAINRAKTIISDLVREAKVGEVYTVPVVRIEKFGAFRPPFQ